MATRTAVALHLAAAPPEQRGLALRAWKLGVELALGAVIVAGGAIGAILLLLVLVVTAPLAAALATWLLWRAGDGRAREARRVRARLRRRARALGLVVLAGSQPGVLRLATAGAKPPAPPPRAVR